MAERTREAEAKINTEDKISREKYWEELSADEKIEKLSVLIVIQQNRMSDLARVVRELSKSHDHKNGRIVRYVDEHSTGVNYGNEPLGYREPDVLHRTPR